MPASSKKKSTRARRPPAPPVVASAPSSAPSSVPAPPSVVEVVEARMKDAVERLDSIVRASIRESLALSAEQSMAANNKAMGELLSIPPAAVSMDMKPITLHDSHRVELETLFGGEPINSPQDVTRLTHRLARVRLLSPSGHEESSVTVPLDYLERLDSRRPIDTTLKEMVEHGFLDYLEGVINGVF